MARGIKWQGLYSDQSRQFQNEDFYFHTYRTAGSGNSNTLKQYCFTAPDVNIDLLTSLFYRIKVFTISGTYRYTVVRSAGLLATPALVTYYTKDQKLYFALDDNNNQMSISSVGPALQERQGSFSFSYKDEAGNIIQVKNGRFHLKVE